MIFPALLFLCAGARLPAATQAKAAPPVTKAESAVEAFAPLEKWRATLLAGDFKALKGMYSTNPEAKIATTENPSVALDEEVAYWCDLKKNGVTAMQFEIVKQESLRADVARIFFQAVTTADTPSGKQKRYGAVVQVWVKQGDSWRLAASKRQEFARLRQPIFPDAELYNAIADASADIQQALARAAREHKRVLLVFGGNWCYDCHVLEAAFHSPEVAPLLAPNFEVVNVDIGRADKNLDIAKKYQVPLEKGVPAIAVLESDGNLLFSQKNGEFEAVRKLGPEELIAFLNQWKPAAPPPRKP
jgi:ketosteroid isomerase-like protein